MNNARQGASFIASITPDVMGCLSNCNSFEDLDDRLCPAENSKIRQFCLGDHLVSESILRAQSFADADIADILAVLAAQGGSCDCEILYNVVESSRLKAECWRAKAMARSRRSYMDQTISISAQRLCREVSAPLGITSSVILCAAAERFNVERE